MGWSFLRCSSVSASPLNMIYSVLNSIWYLTGSQWSITSAGVMCWYKWWCSSPTIKLSGLLKTSSAVLIRFDLLSRWRCGNSFPNCNIHWQSILRIEFMGTFCEIALQFRPIDDKSTLVQVMAWCLLYKLLCPHLQVGLNFIIEAHWIYAQQLLKLFHMMPFHLTEIYHFATNYSY